MDDLKQLKEQYKEELLNNVLPFWIQHSQDKECGGYFTCLDQFGKVFDTDKFIDLTREQQLDVIARTCHDRM